MWRNYSIFILVIFLACTPASSQEAADKLVLLTEINPPHVYQDEETGDLKGISISIVTELLRATGITYEIIVMPWRRAYRQAQTEPNTCVFPTNKTDERTPLFQWISPIQRGGWALFKRPNSSIVIENIADAAQYTMVGKTGSTATDILEKEVGVPIARAVDDMAAVRLLYGGRVDLWLSGYYNGPEAAHMAGLPLPELAFHWRQAEFGIACSMQTSPDFLEMLRQANEKRFSAQEGERAPLQ